jgi:glutathione-regulated potassium-efflux system protein KefB
VVAGNWQLILSGVLAMMAAKALCIYVVARVTHSLHADALDRAVLMAQGGEFAFVLFSAAAAAQVIDATVNANLTAIVVLSMVLTPFFVVVLKRLTPKAKASMEGIEEANGLTGSVLIIGFGRFGQVMSQSLLARDVDVTIIDTDIEMIRSAEEFGFKIYYGDGTRLDVLRACGAQNAQSIAVCIDDKEAASRIVELVKHEFPQALVLVRSFDREHSLALISAGVDFQIRETFESAVEFGKAALKSVGVPQGEADDIAEQIRRRDAERFELEMASGSLKAGVPMLYGNKPVPAKPTPTPFTKPRREARPLNEEAAEAIGEEEEE